jgi:hypothetical protein
MFQAWFMGMRDTVIHSIFNKSMNFLKTIIPDSAQQQRCDAVVDRYEAGFLTISDRYKGFDNIYLSTCIMAVFDDDKIEDVLLVSPPIIFTALLNKNSDYQCSKCEHVESMDNKTMDTFLPDMTYEVVGKDIKYYCRECQEKNPKLKKLKHVGE